MTHPSKDGHDVGADNEYDGVVILSNLAVCLIPDTSCRDENAKVSVLDPRVKRLSSLTLTSERKGGSTLPRGQK